MSYIAHVFTKRNIYKEENLKQNLFLSVTPIYQAWNFMEATEAITFAAPGLDLGSP